MKRFFRLVHQEARQRASQACIEAPDGFTVTVQEPTRNLDQSAKFHAICTDLEKSGFQWFGKARTAKEWKILLVSAHSIATGGEAEVVPGLEGELVNLRESTASMSKKRAASLITYSIAFCDMNQIKLVEYNRWNEYGA